MTRAFNNPFVRYAAVIAGAVLLTALLFPGWFRDLFSSDGFMPHATCYLRNPRIILLHVSSDTLIGVAYIGISLTLAYLVYRASKDIPFHWMFLAFGLFIITCGFTHLMEVWTVWQPVYWLAGYVKLVCAAASVVTAVALVKLVPRIFSFIAAVKTSEERRQKLESANAELEAFAYSVSHDLRAPLRAVQGMAGALEQDFAHMLEPGAKEYLEKIIGAAGRMDALIHDLLEYSRVSRNTFQLGTVNLRKCVLDAQQEVAADVQRSGADIVLEGEFLQVVANATLLTQVLANLMSNAVKFVAPGVKPVVRIWAEQAGRAARVLVKDNGIGIAPEYQEKIFKIFERLHSTSEYPGTGIGLAIVQKAVDRMQGKAGLQSSPGQGSCSWIELPLA